MPADRRRDSVAAHRIPIRSAAGQIASPVRRHGGPATTSSSRTAFHVLHRNARRLAETSAAVVSPKIATGQQNQDEPLGGGSKRSGRGPQRRAGAG